MSRIAHNQELNRILKTYPTGHAAWSAKNIFLRIEKKDVFISDYSYKGQHGFEKKQIGAIGCQN